MEQTSFITSKCGTQSGKYSMHCINYANREQEKPLSFKLTLRSRFTLLQAQFVSCYELLVAFGLSTLNSHRTHHKQRKKKPIKTPTYVLATLQDSNTIMCTNSQTLYTEGSECQRRRQSQQTLLSFGTAFFFTLKTRSIPTVHLSTRVAK